VQPYIGKWLRVGGTLRNVGEWNNYARFAHVSFTGDDEVTMAFNDKKVVQGRLAVLPRGTKMTAVGRIS
jgi:hypothetical protein